MGTFFKAVFLGTIFREEKNLGTEFHTVRTLGTEIEANCTVQQWAQKSRQTVQSIWHGFQGNELA